MALGWGALKQMNDTIKTNRALLGKKKSFKEIYKERIFNHTSRHEKETLEHVQERVFNSLKINQTKERFGRILGYALLCVFIVAVIFVFTTVDFKSKKTEKYEDTESLFKTITYTLPNGTKMRTDYYIYGPRAAETYLEDGHKHYQSESFYESGERFRSASYYYDTLVTDTYFYKTGDTILNFPKLTDKRVYRLKLLTRTKDKEIKFDYFDGKIIQGTYQERSVKR